MGALSCALLGALCLLPIGAPLVEWSYDLPFLFRSHQKIDAVRIIYLDSTTFSKLNQAIGEPLHRSFHTRLLERLTSDKAAVVVYDVEFFDPWPASEPQVDQQFARAMRAHGQVVLGSAVESTGRTGQAVGVKLLRPIPLFNEAAAGLGAVQVDRDVNFAVRKHWEGAIDESHRSLAWAAATAAGAPITREPRRRLQSRWVNYYGPASTLPGVSFHEALSTNTIPTGYFRDKFVFIGAQSMTGDPGEERDEFATPFTRWTGYFAPGVEIQATTFLNLVRGDWLRRLPLAWEALLLLGTGVGLAWGLVGLRPVRGLTIGLVSAAGLFLLAIVLTWQTRIWFPWLIVLVVQLPLAIYWSVLAGYLTSSIRQGMLAQSLELHIAPARVKEILGRPDLLKPGAIERRISILFSDIANFSKVSERLVPEDLVRLLNNYFEATLQCIYETEGTVIKLIGDAIFAIWNAPLDQADHQERICRAALRIRDQLVHFDAEQRSLPLRTRVGLHTGNAYVGNFGSSKRFDFTAIGQSVNLAARLEGLNKYLGTDILLTRDLHVAVEKKFVCRLVGYFRFKGFDRVVEVHELVGTLENESATRPWCTVFEQGMYHYQRRDFARARADFAQTLALHPEDGPARFYLEHLNNLEACPPPADWTGEIDLKEK